MNAATFFTEQQFNKLKELVANEEIISLLTTPFRKQHKINGNTYELSISTGRYVSSNEYHVSIYESHNFQSEYCRNIGGGNYITVNLNSWNDFKNSINKGLKKFPDYSEDEEPEQICLF
jgi:hypothetical protein